MSYYCPHCGMKQNENEKYCINCGAHLSNKLTLNNENGILSLLCNIINAINHWINLQYNKLYLKKYGPNFNYDTLSSDEKYNLFYKETESTIKSQNKMVCGILFLSILYAFLEDTFIGTICRITILVLFFILVIFIFKYALNIIRSQFKTVFSKLLIGYGISILLLLLSLLIPPVGIILIGITIYKNWKRRAFLDKYKRYTRFIFKSTSVIIITQIISTLLGGLSDYTSSNNILFLPLIIEILSLYIAMYGFTLYHKIHLNFFRKEQARGIQFDDCQKLIWLVPITWFMLVFSYLTLIHSSSYSGDNLLANFDGDIDSYMSMDTSIPSETYTLSTDLGEINETIHIDSVINEDNIISPNNNEVSNIIKDNIDTTALHTTDQANNQIFAKESMSTLANTNTEIHPLNTISDPQNTTNAVNESIIDNPTNDYTINNTSTPSNESYAIYDETGHLEEKIVQTDEHTFAIQDSQSMMEGTIHVSSITGDMSLDDVLGIHQGTITNDGIIKGVDGLTDGHIKTEYNGDRIILDDKNQTIGRILNNGIITNAIGMPLGNIKEC